MRDKLVHLLQKAAELDDEIDYFYNKRNHSAAYNKTVKYNKKVNKLSHKECKIERRIQTNTCYNNTGIDNEELLNPEQKRNNKEFHEMDVLYWTFVISIISLPIIVFIIAAIQQLIKG